MLTKITFEICTYPLEVEQLYNHASCQALSIYDQVFHIQSTHAMLAK